MADCHACLPVLQEIEEFCKQASGGASEADPFEGMTPQVGAGLLHHWLRAAARSAGAHGAGWKVQCFALVDSAARPSSARPAGGEQGPLPAPDMNNGAGAAPLESFGTSLFLLPQEIDEYIEKHGLPAPVQL